MSKSNQKPNREKQLVQNTAIIAFGTFIPKLLAIVTLPILTAGLTKAEMGTYDLITILESLFLPCITLQIQAAAFRFLIEYRDNKEKTNEIITNVLLFVAFTSVISLCILFFCLGTLSIKTRIFICCYFLFENIKSAEQQIVRGISSNRVYSKSTVIYAFIHTFCILAFIKLYPQGIDGAMISLLSAAGCASIYIFLKSHLNLYIKKEYVSRKTIIDMLKYSWPMIPNSLSMWTMNLSDRLVLSIVLGIERNAIYAVANKIPSLFSVVQSTFTLAWQENASIASSDKDSSKYYSKMFDIVFCIMVGIMALLIASTPLLFLILIKGDYGEAYYQMPILFMGVFFNSIVAFLGGIYVAFKKTKSVGITTTIAAVLNLVIDLVLVRKIGIFAASISTLVSFVFLAIYRMIDITNFIEIEFKWTKIIVLILSLAGMCFICYQQKVIYNMINMIIAIVLAVALNQELIKKIFRRLYQRIEKKGRNDL